MATGDLRPVATAELYDPASGHWAATASMRTTRYMGKATVLPNGSILVTGGADKACCLTETEIYDPGLAAH